MVDKYNLTRDENVFVAKRNIVDYIWKSANLEGIKITYPETQVIYDGGIVNNLKVDEILAINNLKYAWEYILSNDELPSDFNTLIEIHKIVGDKIVLYPGVLRSIPVGIGGTNWKPELPFESDVKDDLINIINQEGKSKTEIAIETMLYIMRKQMFLDGNKRTAMIYANKIMIDHGKGIISIGNENQEEFGIKLIEYYETNDMNKLKAWIYETSIDGMDFNGN